MKRLLFILPALMLFTSIHAQVFRVGAEAGLMISDVDGVSGTGLVKFGKPGFTIGGLVNTKIGNTTQMQLEISYTEKGSEVFPDTTHNNNYYDLSFYYLDISLSVRQPLHLRVNSKMSDKYGLIFGATFGPLISYSYTVQGLTYDLTGQLNNYDASAFLGFYYNFTPAFFFDLRYSNSFIPAYKHNASTQGFYPFYNSWNAGDNMAFELRLGYRFGTSNEEPASTATPPPAPVK
jgi:hypothetical protein